MCEPPKAQSETDVQAAAAAAKALLEEEKQRKLDILFNAPPPIEGATETSSTESMAYLLVREELVGTIDSSSLLNLDEASDLWPEHLSPAAETDRAVDKDMWWVDELSCVGCTWCADVARSTFRMQNDDCAYGQVRAPSPLSRCPPPTSHRVCTSRLPPRLRHPPLATGSRHSTGRR